MPTYEYACEACGNNWEAEQRITEAALQDCPKCGEPKARRLISGGSRFVLKGGGWYADLYSSKPASKSSESKPTAEAKTESKPAASESKPASSTSSSSSD